MFLQKIGYDGEGIGAYTENIKWNGPLFGFPCSLLVFRGDCCTDMSVVTLFFTALLRSEGHTVEFLKTPDRDDVELVVHGEIIYRCKIQDLQYGKLTSVIASADNLVQQSV